MKKLLNTLYILSENAYLALDGETVNVLFEDGNHRSIPLHTLEGIVCFSYKGASPALMGKCVENGIGISFYSPNGKFLADIGSDFSGNVLLRKQQYRVSESDEALSISKHFVIGKLHNSKYLLLHYYRDHPYQIDEAKIKTAVANISQYTKDASSVNDVEILRGIEGNAAAEYFGVFDDLILQNKDDFRFISRNRRPPMDKTNALLSLAYSLLANECTYAIRSVGLDPYVGFMHTDRPGRKSLALDLMEELRSVFADRFVLSMINNRMINKSDFIISESGAVLLKDDARKLFFSEWQKRKKDEIHHPFTKEKMPWGLVPFIQSLLLARCLRGDIDGYPPFLWK